jgi:hypothetical protein
MLKNKIQNPEKKCDWNILLIISRIFTVFLGLFGVTFGEEEAPPDDCIRLLPFRFESVVIEEIDDNAAFVDTDEVGDGSSI